MTIEKLLESLQARMNELEQALPAKPVHPINPNVPLGEADALFLAEIARLEREIAGLRLARTAWAEKVAAYHAAAAQIESEWTAIAAQWDAVKLTASLLAAPVAAPVAVEDAAPVAAPVAVAVAAPVVVEDVTTDEDERIDAGLSVTNQILSVFTRNPDSTKQWTTREVGLAYAKSIGLGNNASPRLLKQVENTLRRLVKQGRLLTKKSVARGAVVYSLH